MVSYHVDREDQTQVVLVAKTPLPLSQSHVGQVGLNFPHTSPCLIYTVPGSEPRTVYMLGRLSVDFDYRRGREGCGAK